MSEYIFLDQYDNEYTITNQSFRMLGDAWSTEVEIVERSFRAGADFPGIQRDESKELTFSYDINYNTDTAFRAYYNELTMNLRKTVKIKDNTNSIETEVLFKESSITYDDGGYLRGARVDVVFVQLVPYWQDIDYTSQTETGGSGGSLTIVNNGYIETPPIITVTAYENVTKFLVKNETTGEGIVIKDLQFGTAGLDIYIIDCKTGEAELNQTLRNQKIEPGTGFFNIPVGTSIITLEASGLVDMEIKYKQRYWI